MVTISFIYLLDSDITYVVDIHHLVYLYQFIWCIWSNMSEKNKERKKGISVVLL